MNFCSYSPCDPARVNQIATMYSSTKVFQGLGYLTTELPLEVSQAVFYAAFLAEHICPDRTAVCACFGAMAKFVTDAAGKGACTVYTLSLFFICVARYGRLYPFIYINQILSPEPSNKRPSAARRICSSFILKRKAPRCSFWSTCGSSF